MKPFTILFLSILAAAGTAFLVFAVTGPAPSRAEAPKTVGPDPTEALARAVEGLAKRQTDLEKTIEDLRKDIAAQGGSTRIPTGDIEAAVTRALEKRGSAPAAASAAKAAKETPKGDPKTFFDKLAAGSLSWEDAQALWREADQAGVMKDLVAMFEQAAKDAPNDPSAHVALGKAWLQQVYKAGNTPEAGIYASKADKEFDRALAIDDHDWPARFNKAVSLSFWPPIMGKQGEAIANFETLVKQQDEVAAQPQHAQTHLLLGNMYSQMGDKQKAIAAYQKGLSIFPDDAALKKQLASVQPH